MDTFPRDTVVEIGYVQKVHGIAGAVTITFEPEWEITLEESQLLLIETDGILVPWPVEEDGMRITTARSAIVKLRWIDGALEARKLNGKKVFLPHQTGNLKAIPTGINSWIGFAIRDEEGQLSGTILHIDDYSGNVVFTIDQDGSTALIPFHPDLLVNVNEAEKRVVLKIPEGLFETDALTE